MIGDTLDADMGFAKTNGIKSCLVLTGHTKMSALESMKNQGKQANNPDYVLTSVGDIPKWIDRGEE